MLKNYNDVGLSLLFLLITPILNFKYHGILTSNLRFAYITVFFIFIKSMSIFKNINSNNKIINFFGKFNMLYLFSPSNRKKYHYDRFQFVTKLFKENNSVKEKFNSNALFFFTDYIYFISLLPGGIQHVVMGLLLNYYLKKRNINYKIVKDLFIYEVIYEIINYFSYIIYYIQNRRENKHTKKDTVRSVFQTVHFLAIPFLFLISNDTIKYSKDYLLTFNQLFLTYVGIFMIYIVFVSYFLIKYEIKEEKKGSSQQKIKKTKNIVIYVSLIIYYGLFLSKIKKTISIFKLGKLSFNQQLIGFTIVSNIYLYTFFPIIQLFINN